MIGIKRRSDWTFKTAGTGGLGLEFAAVNGGVIELFDPSGKEIDFHFGAVGAGLTYGFKLPFVGKLNVRVKDHSVGASLAPTFFKNGGDVYITDSFKGQELSPSDLRGATLFLDGSLTLIGGASGTAMLLGIDPILLAMAMSMPALQAEALPWVVSRAPAALIMGGATAALQVGFGAAVYVGYLG